MSVGARYSTVVSRPTDEGYVVESYRRSPVATSAVLRKKSIPSCAKTQPF